MNGIGVGYITVSFISRFPVRDWQNTAGLTPGTGQATIGA
jgi:hypothetical protein